jgi:carboxypeptidase C (cathepsin A)
MLCRRFAAGLLLLGLAMLPGSLSAADAPEKKPPAPAEPALPADAVTSHTLKLKDRTVTYTATAGTLVLTGKNGDKAAEVFYVAFTENGANPATRPITFAMNGGPGAGSAYLDVGAIGPRVLDFGNGRDAPPAAAKLIDNPDTWLDFTDLVFIDPVGTGYSRSLGSDEEAKKQFWGVRQDLASLGAIVHRALAHLDRFGSPLYLAGESYGGFRAARLPLRLANDEGVAVNGAVLVSPVLEFSLLTGDPFNPMPWALRLPSYAAVHLETEGKLAPAALQPAEQFALGDYVAALVAAPEDASRSADIYAKMAGFTGLSDTIIARWHGRVPLGIFVKEIRHGEGDLVSRYDGSVAGSDPYPAAAVPESGDPILAGLKAVFTSGFTAYVRDELQFKTDRLYELLNDEVAKRWEWRDGDGGGRPGASDDLREGLALNPHLKVMIAHGMTDLQTPYMTSRYTIEHLPQALTQDRVTLKLYAGGHMMYLRPASRAALHDDARTLYRTANE